MPPIASEQTRSSKPKHRSVIADPKFFLSRSVFWGAANISRFFARPLSWARNNPAFKLCRPFPLPLLLCGADRCGTTTRRAASAAAQKICIFMLSRLSSTFPRFTAPFAKSTKGLQLPGRAHTTGGCSSRRPLPHI